HAPTPLIIMMLPSVRAVVSSVERGLGLRSRMPHTDIAPVTQRLLPIASSCHTPTAPPNAILHPRKTPTASAPPHPRRESQSRLGAGDVHTELARSASSGGGRTACGARVRRR